jgi:hypothetical protein
VASFDIKGGLGGVTMGCRACGALLTRDPQTGNYFCPTEGCGQGHLTGSGGIETTVREDGSVLLTSGKKPS